MAVKYPQAHGLEHLRVGVARENPFNALAGINEDYLQRTEQVQDGPQGGWLGRALSPDDRQVLGTGQLVANAPLQDGDRLDCCKQVRADPRYLLLTEVEALCGDAKKAHRKFGWRP